MKKIRGVLLYSTLGLLLALSSGCAIGIKSQPVIKTCPPGFPTIALAPNAYDTVEYFPVFEREFCDKPYYSPKETNRTYERYRRRTRTLEQMNYSAPDKQEMINQLNQRIVIGAQTGLVQPEQKPAFFLVFKSMQWGGTIVQAGSGEAWLGVASFFLPLLSLIPHGQERTHTIEYQLYNPQGQLLWGALAQGQVEGRYWAWYIGYNKMPSKLAWKLQELNGQGAAITVLNHIYDNSAAILAASEQKSAK